MRKFTDGQKCYWAQVLCVIYKSTFDGKHLQWFIGASSWINSQLASGPNRRLDDSTITRFSKTGKEKIQTDRSSIKRKAILPSHWQLEMKTILDWNNDFFFADEFWQIHARRTNAEDKDRHASVVFSKNTRNNSVWVCLMMLWGKKCLHEKMFIKKITQHFWST